MKLAIQEGLLPGKTYKEKLEHAERLGFKGIEIWGRDIEKKIKVLKELLPSFKVVISTVCSGYQGDLLGLNRTERELAIKSIKERLSAAAELGAIGLIVVPTFGGPKLPDLYPLFKNVWELEKSLLIPELKELGRYAEEVGVYILLEPLNRYETHFLNRLGQAVAICKEVNMEYIKIMADFFHMNIEEVKISESLREAFPFLRHIHLADSNRLPPGFGHTDFKSAFDVLRERGYKYFMALECRVPPPQEESLKKCVEFLRNLMG